MGNYVIKLFPYDDENDTEESEIRSNAKETTIEEEGMHTPQTARRQISIDPRSATIGIQRTPIQVDCTPVGSNTKMITAIPRHLQKMSYLESDTDRLMPILTPKKRFVSKWTEEGTPKENNQNEQTLLMPSVDAAKFSKVLTPTDIQRYKILGLDPRSPAVDFERTPILMPKSMERLRARSCEKLNRRGSYETDMCSKFSYCETLSPFDITEVQTLPEMAAQALQCLNLIDIDSDNKLNESSSSSSNDSPIIRTVSKSGRDITFARNSELILDAILAEQKVLTLEEKKLKTRGEIEINTLKQDSSNTICNEDTPHKLVCTNDSDRIRVWRDSSSEEEIEDSEFDDLGNMEIDRKETDAIKQDVIITYDDDSLTKSSQPLKVTGDSECQKKAEIIGKKKSLKPDVKIMGDDKKMFFSDSKIGNESPKTRTPLGNRSNNGKMLLTKSPQQLFRNKGIRPMMQENTPPHKRGSVKPKLNSIEWDLDENVIM